MEVQRWMTPVPVTVRPEDTLEDARKKMKEGKFRRLPVVDEKGTLVGIVTDGDLRAHAGYLATTKVSGVMIETPITVAPDDQISKAVQLMLDSKIGGLPVVSGDGRPIGIITESDLLGFLNQARKIAEMT
jgi:CBS domain-containing protein